MGSGFSLAMSSTGHPRLILSEGIHLVGIRRWKKDFFLGWALGPLIRFRPFPPKDMGRAWPFRSPYLFSELAVCNHGTQTKDHSPKNI